MSQVAKYSYGMFCSDIKHITQSIKESGYEIDLIVALTRGGLIPGVALSHALDKPMMTMQWNSKGDNKFESSLKAIIKKKKQNILIVDDICDRGTTLTSLFDYVRNYICEPDMSKIKVAALVNYFKAPICNYTGLYDFAHINQPWVEFFWETLE